MNPAVTTKSSGSRLLAATAVAAALLIVGIAAGVPRTAVAPGDDVPVSRIVVPRAAAARERQHVAAVPPQPVEAHVDGACSVEEESAPPDTAGGRRDDTTLRIACDGCPMEQLVEQLQRHTPVRLIVTRRAAEVPVTLNARGVTWREALDDVVRAARFHVEQPSPKVIVVDYVRATYAYDDADLRGVLCALAEVHSADLVLGPEVTGRVTIAFRDVPWRVALDRIAAAGGFEVVERACGVLSVRAPSREDASGRAWAPGPTDAEWDAVRAASGMSGVVTFDADGRPLAEIVELIQARTDVHFVLTDDARTRPVAIKVRDLPWADALRVVVERSGCRVRVRAPTLLLIERLPSVSVSYDDFDLRETLRTLAQMTAESMVIDPDVEGRVTATLPSVPCRVAIETIAREHGCVVVEGRSGILHVRRAAASAGLEECAEPPLADGTPVSFHVAQRPLGDVVALVREAAGVDVEIAGREAADAPLTLTVRGLPWPQALWLAVHVSGCRMRQEGPGRFVIDRPPRVTAELVDAAPADAFREIASQGGARVEVAPDLRGTLTACLFDVPWHDALEACASALGVSVVDAPDGTIHIGGAPQAQPTTPTPRLNR